MKTGLLAGVVLCLVAGILDVASREEPGKEPDALPPLPLPVVPPDEAPTSGTFYTFQRADHVPPLPMNQFPELPLYSLGDGFYLVDDRTVDYAALEAERTRCAVQELAASLGVTEAEAADVMTMSVAMGAMQASGLTTNGLHLLPPTATNGGFRIEMGGGAAGAVYDLFSTTNLASTSATNSWWQWRGRVANASPRILPDTNTQMFYILGTTQDTDGGGLTDAYERLVTHTLTNNPADDARPLVGIDLANTVVREQGGTTTQFNVWRVGSTAQPLAVALQRTGTATPGLDFTLAPIGNDAYPMDCVVTIPQGATNLLVTLTALPDSVVEPSETVTLTVPAGWPTFRPARPTPPPRRGFWISTATPTR